MVGDIRVMGIIITEGKPKEIQEKFGVLAKAGMQLLPASAVASDYFQVSRPIKWRWPIPFPGDEVPFLARRVFEREGFVEKTFANRNLAPLARFKVDPDIRGGIRNYHIHLGNEVLILNAQTFEHLARAAADELIEQGEGNAINW